ncbi:MAG: glycosyltransferase family 2 protein, partial [Myxococcota bacterium]
VPTHERVEQLRACLASLAEQEPAGCVHEVVVVDDGSGDGTTAWLAAAERMDWPFRFVTLRQRQGGPAVARNAGVRAASGDVVLFTGDDCVAAPGCIAEHLEARRGRAGADSVLGFTTWLPSLDITPFMHFQENGGSQFAYWRITDPENAGWLSYYTTNISTPRPLLLAHPFEERFRAARYEDLELGYRLEQAGHRVVYRPDALVWHDHPITFEGFRAACEGHGEFAALFHQLHPEDEALARSLGVRDAQQADQVFGPGLDAARELIAETEPRLGAAPAAAFGVRGATALLHEAYRLCIHHALLCGIRKALSLPAPCTSFEGED